MNMHRTHEVNALVKDVSNAYSRLQVRCRGREAGQEGVERLQKAGTVPQQTQALRPRGDESKYDSHKNSGESFQARTRFHFS